MTGSETAGVPRPAAVVAHPLTCRVRPPQGLPLATRPVRLLPLSFPTRIHKVKIRSSVLELKKFEAEGKEPVPLPKVAEPCCCVKVAEGHGRTSLDQKTTTITIQFGGASCPLPALFDPHPFCVCWLKAASFCLSACLTTSHDRLCLLFWCFWCPALRP